MHPKPGYLILQPSLKFGVILLSVGTVHKPLINCYPFEQQFPSKRLKFEKHSVHLPD